MLRRTKLILTIVVTFGAAICAEAAIRDPAHFAHGATKVAAKTVGYKLGDCCTPAPAPVCKTYQPCVSYKGCLDCCGPKVKQVLKVQDPCDCCCSIAEIPVCLPACCKDACVRSKCGLFGRGIVTYSYDCGVCVKVVFTKCGDVVVIYRG